MLVWAITLSAGGRPYSEKSSVVCASLTSDGVVAAGERAVDRRSDAGVGLRAGDDEPTHTALGELGLQGGVLERVAVLLVHQRLGLLALQLRHVLPAVAALGKWSSECCTQITGTCSARASSTRVLMFAITSSRRWALATTVVLHVHHQQGGVGTVLQAGHAGSGGLSALAMTIYHSDEGGVRAPAGSRPCGAASPGSDRRDRRLSPLIDEVGEPKPDEVARAEVIARQLKLHHTRLTVRAEWCWSWVVVESVTGRPCPDANTNRLLKTCDLVTEVPSERHVGQPRCGFDRSTAPPSMRW